MMDKALLNYSLGYMKNVVSNYLYSIFNVNISKPAQISALLTYKCNSRCRMCSYWRRESSKEMSVEEWKQFLTAMKKWHKNAHIQFSGGEPFVKKNAIEIFEHCSKIGFSYGVTTNLTILPRGGMERFVNATPFNINISLDGMKPETHDSNRGVPGTFDRLIKNLNLLTDAAATQNRKIRIIIKSIIMNHNLDELEDMVRFVRDKKLTGINLQPVFKWPDTSSDDYWITDFDKIEDVSRKLLEMKKNGFPILTPERDLMVLKKYFMESITLEQHTGKCIVGIKNFDIIPNGDVFLCRTLYGKVGNISKDRPSKIWHSEMAAKERNRILNCKKLCLGTCQTKRTIKDLYYAFKRLSEAK